MMGIDGPAGELWGILVKDREFWGILGNSGERCRQQTEAYVKAWRTPNALLQPGQA